MQNLIETTAKRMNGYVAVFFFTILLAANAWLIYYMAINEEVAYLWAEIPLFLVTLIFLFGFIIVQPNEAKVLILFGKYIGSVREAGFCCGGCSLRSSTRPTASS